MSNTWRQEITKPMTKACKKAHTWCKVKSARLERRKMRQSAKEDIDLGVESRYGNDYMKMK